MPAEAGEPEFIPIRDSCLDLRQIGSVEDAQNPVCGVLRIFPTAKPGTAHWGELNRGWGRVAASGDWR